MKKLFVFVYILFAVSVLFFSSACTKNTYGEAELLGEDAPLASITPVSALPLPLEVEKIPESAYSYDDLSIRTKIEFMGDFYGIPNSNPDPIAQYLGKKYNADITYTSVAPVDTESIISTRFAVGDEPDVIIMAPHLRQITRLLYDQGLVADATIAMRYMPNFAQYFTQDYADFIGYKNVYTAAPRYLIQGQYDAFIRKDWLEKFGMDMPSTLDELLVYARRVTWEDPDGNGRNDTWFAGGAGSGYGFGMLSSLVYYFGDPNFNVKDGMINHPYLDGTYKNFLTFLKQLNDEGLLAPDWYTIDWEAFKTYSLNGRIGFVFYPAADIVQEMLLSAGQNTKNTDTSWDIWTPLPPIGTNLAPPPPGPSYMFVFPSKTLRDPVKFKRICHILDKCLFGGPEYFNTVQAGGNDVFGREVHFVRHNADGSVNLIANMSTHPAWNGELDTTGLANAGWQTIALAGPPYSLYYWPDNPYATDLIPKLIAIQSSFNRWQNNFKIGLDPDITADLTFLGVEESRFVLGGRDLARWDEFVNEWLNRGGRRALAEVARQLNVEDYSISRDK